MLLFEMKGIRGPAVHHLADKDHFDKWISEQLSDLTKLGLPSEALDRWVRKLLRFAIP